MQVDLDLPSASLSFLRPWALCSGNLYLGRLERPSNPAQPPSHCHSHNSASRCLRPCGVDSSKEQTGPCPWSGLEPVRVQGRTLGNQPERTKPWERKPITGASEQSAAVSLCELHRGTCFPKMWPVPTRGQAQRCQRRGEVQSNGSRAAGCRRGIGGCPHGAGSDNALWPPGLSGGCHPQALQPQGLWAGSLENPAGQVRGLPW